MIRVRPAREDDYDALAQVWFEAYHASSDEIRKPSPELLVQLRERIPREVESGAWKLFAALDGERIVAILAIRPADNSLDQIFIADGYRSRGIGSKLLDFVKREIPDGFWLRTHISNAKAQRFYAREGMRHTHDAPHPRHPEAMFRHYRWMP